MTTPATYTNNLTVPAMAVEPPPLSHHRASQLAVACAVLVTSTSVMGSCARAATSNTGISIYGLQTCLRSRLFKDFESGSLRNSIRIAQKGSSKKGLLIMAAFTTESGRKQFLRDVADIARPPYDPTWRAEVHFITARLAYIWVTRPSAGEERALRACTTTTRS